MNCVNKQTGAIVALICFYTCLIAFLYVNGIHPGIIVLLTIFSVTILMIILAKLYSGARKREMLLLSGVIQILSGFVVTIILPSGVSDPIRIALLSVFIGIGVILVIKGFIMNNSGDDRRIQDERSLRIGTYGLSYSWYLTYLTVAAIGLLAGSEMTSISGAQICFLLIILMPLSARIFQWYFNSKGDVY